MADAPDLGSGPVRGGGSSPLSRTNLLVTNQQQQQQKQQQPQPPAASLAPTQFRHGNRPRPTQKTREIPVQGQKELGPQAHVAQAPHGAAVARDTFSGQTVMFVGINGKASGMVVVADSIKA